MSFAAWGRVDENDILQTVFDWLRREGWSVSHFSPANGQPKGGSHRLRVAAAISDATTLLPEPTDPDPIGAAVSAFWANEGPDLVASKGDVTWSIECKGYIGSGGVNRDYAISSVVASYGWDSYSPHRRINRLGIAVPDSPDWRSFRDEWLSPALLNKLDLWMLWIKRDGEGYSVEEEGPRPTGDLAEG
jgi:hypothetical protein